MSNLKIAILGSNSHIAKGLINNFLRNSTCSLYLYTRNVDNITGFANSIEKAPGNTYIIINGYTTFMMHHYDVIINCVGIGTPNELHNNYYDWFMVTEKYDYLVIKYLCKNSDTFYVNFSSGAVYGSNGSEPASENTVNKLRPNHICIKDFYTISNLNSEAKHRSFDQLKIVDIRIFSYFSKFIDLNSGYFITEILKCITDKKIFYTNDENIVRDYIHPDDLYSLILRCIQSGKINSAFDAVSLNPVEKQQILNYFSANYDFEYETNKNLNIVGPNGSKKNYYSNYNSAAIIGYKPIFCSMETIEQESKSILSKNGFHSKIVQ